MYKFRNKLFLNSLLITKGLEALTTWIGIAYVCVLFVLIYKRMSFPLELSTVEGSLLDGINRIIAGKPLYSEPTLNYVATVYNPLYFYVSAFFASFFEMKAFSSSRLLSFASTIFSCCLIFLLVHKETKNRFYAFISVSLFAGSYHHLCGFYDLCRVDAFHLFLLLGSIVILRLSTIKPLAFFAGLVLVASFFVKQTTLVMTVPIVIYELMESRIKGLYLCAGLVVGTLLGYFLILMFNEAQWLQYYTFTIPFNQGIIYRRILGFFSDDLVAKFPIAILSIVAFFVEKSDDSVFSHNRKKWLGMLIVTAGMGSFLGRIKEGGWVNADLPIYSLIAISFGICLHSLREHASFSGEHDKIQLGFAFAIFLQIFGLFYNPMKYIPTKADLENSETIINRLRNYGPHILYLENSYLAQATNSEQNFDLGSAVWITSKRRDLILEETNKTIKERRFEYIVTPHYGRNPLFNTVIMESYELVDQLPTSSSLFSSTTDAVYPENVYRVRY